MTTELERHIADLEDEIESWQASTGLVVGRQGDPDGVTPADNERQLDLLWYCVAPLRQLLTKVRRLSFGKYSLVVGFVETDALRLADAAQAQLPKEAE